MSLLTPLVAPFSPSGWSRGRTLRLFSDFVDAEFERVSTDGASPDDTVAVENDDDDTIPVLKSNSILDMALKDNNVTFPFVEPGSQQSLSCRLSVTAELDDETYAVGTPAQHGVLMVVERNEGQELEYIDPDEDENVELLEIMAGALEKYMSSDLKLQRTPRILTIAGDLEQYTDDFSSNLVSEEMTMENMMKEPDTDLDKLFDFFKEQLGDEVYEETMKDDDFELPTELEGLFDMQTDDDDEPLDPADLEEAFRKLGEDLQHDGVGLKIVGFQVNNNEDKTKPPNPSFYSLVKPLKPLTVVGRLRQEDGQQTIFELLTPEEETLIVPRLEQVCKEDMEARGITLNAAPSSPKKP